MYVFTSCCLLVPRPCGRPKVIPHLKYTGSSFNFKDTLKYECDVGFKLKGPKRRKCGINGKWSRAPKCLGSLHSSSLCCLSSLSVFPFCETMDCKPQILAHSKSPLQNPYLHMAVQAKWCFTLRLFRTINRCYFLFPSGPCKKPSDIPHAHVEGSSYDFKDTLSYSCVRGYKLNGPISRKCLENGVWSTAPSCSRKS